MIQTGRNSNLSEILCFFLLPASIKRIGPKKTEKWWRHHFTHYKSMGAFCCHGNQSFDPIYPKTLCILSPTPVMLHIKFDQDWPTGFWDIQVWKWGSWRTDIERRRTDGGPLVYCKLTLRAFGSGELIKVIFSQVKWYQFTTVRVIRFEPPHDKTNKMACAPIDDSD